MPYFLNCLFHSIFFSKFCHIFYFHFGLAISCLHLFLFVFSSSLKFCGDLALSKCGLLWHLSLEIYPIHKETWLRKEFVFLSNSSLFFHLGRGQFFYVFCYIPCFSNCLFIVFCVCLIIWIIFLVENPLNNILLKKLSDVIPIAQYE